MQFSEKQNYSRWIIIITSFVIVLMILWNTYSFFQIFKDDERDRMKQWAQAQKTFNLADENTDVDLPLLILQGARIPIIVTQNDSIINHNNIDKDIVNDKQKLKLFLQKLKSQNLPIPMKIATGKYWNIYYGDSDLLTKLKYYPVALLLIIFLFAMLVYNYYKSTKIGTQNKLWAGMAKETAHQIGTPRSSLSGWVESMKADNVDETTITEIEKDIVRLQTITDRFSKIGSEPKLETLDLVAETKKSFEYLQARFSKQVEFAFDAPTTPLLAKINPELHSWTVENLVKNAIDAMRGKGKLRLQIKEEDSLIKIYVSDTGKGIPKNQFRKVFEPGFTTKRRGWGLGLSLTKRIVEEYHNGKIKVFASEIDKGTIIVVSLKKVSHII